MSIVSPTMGETFSVHIFKALTLNPSYVWCNSYELNCVASESWRTDLMTAAGKLVDFEQALHFDDVTFKKVVVSTWEPDGTPYNPNAFTTEALTIRGSRVSGSGGQLMPLTIVLNVQRSVMSGKVGRIAYRGCLIESDVESPSGTPIATDRAGMITRIDNAKVAHLLDMISAPESYQLVLVDKLGNVREVSDVRYGNLSSHKTSRRRKVQTV